MEYLNEYHRVTTQRKIAKPAKYREYLQSLTPQERAQIAEREARLAKERVAEAARLYPDRK